MPKLSLPVCIVVLTTAAPSYAQPSRPLSLDAVIARYIEGRGGHRALNAVTSLTYTADMGNGRIRRMIKMRPNYFLVGCTEPACAVAEGFDGSAWEMYPRKQRVIRARLEAAKSLRRMSEFDEPVIGWREKGHSAELKGIEDFEGRPAYRIDMVLNDGLPMSCYIGTGNYVMLGNRRPVPMHSRGEHVETINVFEDYRPVAGVLYPFRIRTLDAKSGKLVSGARGWDRIEANISYVPSQFTPPPVTPPPLTSLVLYLLEIAGSVSPASQWFRPYAAFRSSAAGADVDSSEDLTWLGYELLKQDATSEAVAAFQTVIDEHPDSADAYNNLGEALYQCGRTADALRAFEQAQRRDPSSEEIRAKLKELREHGKLLPRY